MLLFSHCDVVSCRYTVPSMVWLAGLNVTRWHMKGAFLKMLFRPCGPWLSQRGVIRFAWDEIASFASCNGLFVHSVNAERQFWPLISVYEVLNYKDALFCNSQLGNILIFAAARCVISTNQSYRSHLLIQSAPQLFFFFPLVAHHSHSVCLFTLFPSSLSSSFSPSTAFSCFHQYQIKASINSHLEVLILSLSQLADLSIKTQQSIACTRYSNFLP